MRDHRFGFAIVGLFIVLALCASFIILVAEISIAANLNAQWWSDLTANFGTGLDVFCYVCITILLAVEAKNFRDFFLERASIVLLLLGSVLFCLQLLVSKQTFFFEVMVISLIALLLIITRNWSAIPRTNLSWSVKEIGMFISLLVLVILFESLQKEIYTQIGSETFQPIIFAVRRTIQNLASASVIEEFLFRGFFWGYLRMKIGNEQTSFRLQALIFWLLHISKIFITPLTFFITLPIATLLYSVVAKDKKQIFGSIILHTILNVMIVVVLTNWYVR